MLRREKTRFWADTQLTVDYGFERLKVVKLKCEILGVRKKVRYMVNKKANMAVKLTVDNRGKLSE